MTDAAAAAVRIPVMTELRTAVIGALVVMLGPISLALYTPAMPELVRAFGTEVATVKLTLTVYFFGFAFSQLICGPLSDAFGRRPVALGFFGIYLAGSLIAVLSPTVEWLIAGRALQGVGCAAGIAISRAIVRDQFTGQAAARIMNLIGTMLAIGPAISPTLGGIILGVAGWQMIFVVMALYGVAVVLVLALAVPETNTTPDRALAAPRRMMASYAVLLADRVFMRAALVIGFTLGGIYTLSALLPFILIGQAHLTPVAFGFAMVGQTGSFMAGTLVVARLLKRFDAMRLVPVGLALVALAAASLALAPRLLPLTAATVMVPVGLWAFGIALMLPGNATSALSGFGHIAGAASALMGFMQIGGGFFGSGIAAILPDPLTALTTILPAMALAALAAHMLLAPRRAGPAVAVPFDEAEMAENLEVAADPAGLVGAAGDEIEAGTFRRSA